MEYLKLFGGVIAIGVAILVMKMPGSAPAQEEVAQVRAPATTSFRAEDSSARFVSAPVPEAETE